MFSIDAAILNVTERFCRRFQLLTGRTNVWLAFQLTNLSIVVYFAWAALQFWRGDGAPRVFLALFAGGVLYLLTQTIFRVSVDTYEASTYQRVAKGLRNPRRVRDVPLRLPFLTLSILLLYPSIFVYQNLRLPFAVLSYSLVVLTTIVLYLLACDPLPPCPGTVWAWVRSVAGARRLPDAPLPHEEVRRRRDRRHDNPEHVVFSFVWGMPRSGQRPYRARRAGGARSR